MPDHAQEEDSFLNYIGYLGRFSGILAIVMGIIGIMFDLPNSIYFIIGGVIIGAIGYIIGILLDLK
jgi:hypothetical protein